MSTKTIKLIVFLALLVHGIGHIQGVITGLGIKFTGNTANISWLLKSASENTNKILCVVLYFIAAIAGILAALAFKEVLLPLASWKIFAMIAAFASTFSLVLFPNALAMFFNKAGAVAVNLIIYYSVLFNGNWPSVIFED